MWRCETLLCRRWGSLCHSLAPRARRNKNRCRDASQTESGNCARSRPGSQQLCPAGRHVSHFFRDGRRRNCFLGTQAAPQSGTCADEVRVEPCCCAARSRCVGQGVAHAACCSLHLARSKTGLRLELTQLSHTTLPIQAARGHRCPFHLQSQVSKDTDVMYQSLLLQAVPC